MPFLPLRPSAGLALLLALVALLAPLRADTIEVDVGTLTTGQQTGSASLPVYCSYTVYFGCLPAYTADWGWTCNGYQDGQFPIPAVASGMRKDMKNFPGDGTTGIQSVGIPGPFTTSEKDFNVSVTLTAKLHRSFGGLLLKDSQSHTFNIKGKIKYQAGASTNLPGKWVSGVWSLKDGGPASGKKRLPGDPDPEEPIEPDKTNVLTDYPKYTVGEDGRVYETVPPNYTIGTQTGNWGTGTNWRAIEHDPGTSWAPPGHVSFTDGSGNKWIAAAQGRDFSGWTGTVYTGPDGTVRIDINGSGYGQNYAFTFPPGFKPTKLDASAPSGVTPITKDDIDPCFHAAADDQDIPGGGGGTDPEPPDGPPDGTKNPDPVTLPPVPGGGAGPGGGTYNPPPVTPPTPPPGGGSGGDTDGPPAPGYSPGKPLPGDDAASVMAGEMAGQVATKAGSVQAAAQGFMGKFGVSPASFGVASSWETSITVMGHVYTIEIPTDHAPLIRALTLLLFIGCFIRACFKTLTVW